MNSPVSKIHNRLATEEQIEAALTAAALDAIRENQRFGLPVLDWRDGQIVRLDPFEAEALLRRNRNVPDDL